MCCELIKKILNSGDGMYLVVVENGLIASTEKFSDETYMCGGVITKHNYEQHKKQRDAILSRIRQARADETDRAKNIRDLGKEFKFADMAEYAIEQDWTEEQFRSFIISRIRCK